MLVESLVRWIFGAAWVIVLGLIVFVQLPRGVREARRIVERALALVDGSPLPLQIAKAQADAERIGRLGAQVAALDSRARAAIAVIRQTPIVPPALRETVAYVDREIRAFRAALR